MAKKLGASGASVVVNDLDAKPADETVEIINQNGGAAVPLYGSITSDGFVLLRNGVNIHFLLTTFTDPDGKIAHPILMYL